MPAISEPARDERGQSTVEYAVITAVVVLPLIVLAHAGVRALVARGGDWFNTAIDGMLSVLSLGNAVDVAKELWRH